MSFDEVRFPPTISFGAIGGPRFNTSIVEIYSGYEKRNKNWIDARAEYSVAHDIKSQSELDILVNFFRARAGKARGFRFRDWVDYKLQSQQIGIGTSALTQFQIIKTYTSGSVTDTRNISKVVSQSDSDNISLAQANPVTNWSVLINGVLKTETTDYTVNRNTGVITFLTAPTTGHTIVVNGEFDVPVRFDTDTMAATLDYHNSASWGGIPLVEVRV